LFFVFLLSLFFVFLLRSASSFQLDELQQAARDRTLPRCGRLTPDGIMWQQVRLELLESRQE
jgi:hypothetical protein